VLFPAVLDATTTNSPTNTSPMISEPSASHHSVMFCTLYVVLEAGYFLHQHISYHGKPGKTQTHGSNTIEEWKRELVSRSAKGALMVDKWVNDWFEVLFKESANGNIKEFKRGNVEEFLSGTRSPTPS
jgi:hypothetical protein